MGGCAPDHLRDDLERCPLIEAEFGGQLDVRCRQRQIDGGDAALDRRLEIPRRHPAPGREPHRETPGDRGANCFDLVAAHARRADLDLWDAGCRERLGELQLFRNGEGNAGCLLAIAQGGIVEEDTTVHERKSILLPLWPRPD